MLHRTIIFALVFLGGCAASDRARRAPNSAPNPNNSTSPTTRFSLVPATRPTLDRRAMLALDQIEDRPVLPLPSSAASAPSAGRSAPLESLELYAKARDALATNQRFNAVNLLERAVQIDPYSAELQRTLARAYLASGNTGKAIASLRAAADLEPTHLRTRTSLGRLLLTHNEPGAALIELRLALQTPDYTDNKDEAGAAIADFFLARALHQQGYDRAALDSYQQVLKRLDRPTLALRQDPELTDWAARPESILAEVGRISERLGDWERALAAWKEIANEADRGDENFEAHKHVIDNQIALARGADALREAAAVVRQSGASARSLELLRDTSRRVGNENAAFDEMRKLQTERPNDRALLFALVDLLVDSDRPADAERLLTEAVRAKYDVELVRKLFEFYASRNRAPDAAILLIEAAAARPSITGELSDYFGKLQRPSRADSLRASDVAKLEVVANARGAKDYFLADAALRGGRDQMARAALERSVHAKPTFPPALVAAMSRVPTRPDLDDTEKAEASKELVTLAEQTGERGAALAEELRAIEFAARQNRAEAVAAFDRAIKLGGKDVSADTLIAYSDLQQAQDNGSRAEQLLWRVVSDDPTNVGAYLRLFAYQAQRENGVGAGATNVLSRWLANDPASVEARLRQAQVLVQSARPAQQQEAVRIAGELSRTHADDPDVLALARLVYDRAGNKELFERLLDELHQRDPANLAVTEALSGFYDDDKRSADALRVLGSARAAVSTQPKALYYLSALYARAQQKDVSRDVLLDVLKIAPDDPGANNDLGYTWADDGMNLDRAEVMCRRAVQAEPDNSSFLDSLGWVLYKRGRFAEARQQLQSAASASGAGSAADLTGDPVMLDHLGDTLYRMNQRDAATASWRQSRDRIQASGRARTDWQMLGAMIEKKLEQADAGGPIDVAPVVSANNRDSDAKSSGGSGGSSGGADRTSTQDARDSQSKHDD